MYTRRAQHQHVMVALRTIFSIDLQHKEPSQPITQNLCVTKELDDELKRYKEMEAERQREKERERETERETERILVSCCMDSISVQLYGQSVGPPQCKDLSLAPNITDFTEIRWTSPSIDSIEIYPTSHTHTHTHTDEQPN